MQVADPADYDLNLNVEPGYIAVKPQLLPRIPRASMLIDYTAGYDAADPAAVPMMIRMAILVGVAHYYENRGDVPAEMPAAFYRLLDPWRLWTFAGWPPRLPAFLGGLRGAAGPGRGNHAG